MPIDPHQKVSKLQVITSATDVLALTSPSQKTVLATLWDSAGSPVVLPKTDLSGVLLTGYTSHAVGNLAAGDTVLVGLAKLEARVAALEV